MYARAADMDVPVHIVRATEGRFPPGLYEKERLSFPVIQIPLLLATGLQDLLRNRLFWIAFSLAAVSVWATYDYIHQYLSVRTVIVGILVVFGMIGVILVLLTEAHEWAEAIWVKERRRMFKPMIVDDVELPMASIHVPTYNEPPEMVKQTLDALARLDYPKYEVIVVDNNTKDEAVWRPVEEHCQKLGARFKFYHVDPLTGFKAGALNYALDHTDSGAEIIGVIDSDYKGEIIVALCNHGESEYVIKPGERMAQLVFVPVYKATLEETQELTETDRGAGGFGSTGK